MSRMKTLEKEICMSHHKFKTGANLSNAFLNRVRYCIIILLLVAIFPILHVYAAKGDLTSSRTNAAKKPPLQVTLGKAEILKLPDGITDVLVADPNVIDVQAIKSDRLYVVGMDVGDTNIIVLDAQGNVLKRMDVHVTYDLHAIQALIDKLFPDESIEIGAIHDQILMTGTVSNPEIAARAVDIVAAYVGDLQDEQGTADELIVNLMEVHGEQQVMLQVKIVEAERSVIKELGVDLRANDPNELSATTLFGATPFSSAGGGTNAIGFSGGQGIGLSQDPVGSMSAFLDTGLNGIGTLGLFLQALEEENLINILAEPNLTSVSGQQAGFLAGGEFPVPTGRDQVGNIVIEFREFGVSLNFRPVVLSQDRISLQLNTEVSSLDNANAIVLADLTVPGLDIRRAETTIEIPSGGSLMIAGLLQSQMAEGMSGLPGIKGTPVLGDLIASDSFRRDESELIVIVTAYLVEPFAQKDRPAPVPRKKDYQLSKIFETNIRRMYGLDGNDLFADAGAFGYIAD